MSIFSNSYTHNSYALGEDYLGRNISTFLFHYTLYIHISVPLGRGMSSVMLRNLFHLQMI